MNLRCLRSGLGSSVPAPIPIYGKVTPKGTMPPLPHSRTVPVWHVDACTLPDAVHHPKRAQLELENCRCTPQAFSPNSNRLIAITSTSRPQHTPCPCFVTPAFSVLSKPACRSWSESSWMLSPPICLPCPSITLNTSCSGGNSAPTAPAACLHLALNPRCCCTACYGTGELPWYSTEGVSPGHGEVTCRLQATGLSHVTVPVQRPCLYRNTLIMTAISCSI